MHIAFLFFGIIHPTLKLDRRWWKKRLLGSRQKSRDTGNRNMSNLILIQIQNNVFIFNPKCDPFNNDENVLSRNLRGVKRKKKRGR